jgi:iron complex outermembrane recepter protein
MYYKSYVVSGLISILIYAIAGNATEKCGRVIDASGRPLAAVNVTVFNGYGSYGTATDENGNYCLQLDENDNEDHQVSISHIGYLTQKILISELSANENNFTLSRTYLENIPLTVVAGRVSHENDAISYSNIDKKEIEQKHHGQDLAALLQGTPSLVTSSYAGSGIGYNEIRLRGFDQKRVEVLVNGIPLNDPEDHNVYWVDLPDMGNSLQDIQIQRGAGTGQFGGSNFGGSINMLTSLSKDSQINMESGIGSYNTMRNSLGFSSGLVKNHWMMEGRWSQIKSDGFRDGTNVDMWGYYISAQRIIENGNIRFNHYNGRELTHVAWNGIDETMLYGLNGRPQNRTFNDYTNYANSVDDYYQPHFELISNWALTDETTLDVTLYHVQGNGFYETYKQDKDPYDYALDAFTDAEEIDLVNRRWIDKIQNGLSARISQRLSYMDITVGLNIYDYKGEHFGEVVWASELTNDPIPGDRYYTHLADKTWNSGFLSLSHDLDSRLFTTLTVSVSRSLYNLQQRATGNFQNENRHGFEDVHTFIDPSIGVRYRHNEQLSVYSSVAMAHREPSRSEYWNAWEGPDDLGVSPMFATSTIQEDGSIFWSNPLIDPERMIDFELGIEHRGLHHNFQLNFYWMDLRNEIVNFGAVDEDSPVKGNVPKSHHAGIEISAEANPFKKLRLGGNSTFDFSRIDELKVYDTYFDAEWNSSVVTRDFSGNHLTLTPDLTASLWIDWSPSTWISIRSSMLHIGKQYLDNSNDDGFTALAPELIDAGYLNVDGRTYFSKTLPSYTTVNLDASADLQRFVKLDINVSLHIENLLDKEYVTGGYWNDWIDSDENWAYEPQRQLYPAAGRNWMTTLKLNF